MTDEVPTMEPPDCVKVKPASEGRMNFELTVSSAKDCREVALWFLRLGDVLFGDDHD